MIHLKIKYKKRFRKYSIPTFDELTAKQYLDFCNTPVKDPIDYLSIVLNKKRDVISRMVIPEPEKLWYLIGKEKNFENYKLNRKYFLDYDIKEIETIGQRYTITRNIEAYKGFEIYVFFLAVALANNDNLEDIQEIYSKLLQENYYEVLGLGFFLKKNLEYGMIKEQRTLRKLPIMMKMKILEYKRAIINWLNGVFILNYKHYVNS